jgi:hypothetical protein
MGCSDKIIYTIGLWHAALVYEASVNQTFKINSMKLIEAIFDVDEYINSKKRILDCIFCHFANVATTGLILMLVIYSTKDLYATLHTNLIRFIGVVLITPAFYAYSLFFLRLMKGLSRFNKSIIISISAIVFFIDMQSITIFIKSTPAIEIQEPQNNLTKT